MAEAVDAPFDRPDVGFNALPGWTWVGCYGGYYLQADSLAAFEHGFFTRQWQGRGPGWLAGYVSAGVSVHRPQQVHGAEVLPASAAAVEPWPEADGLCSNAPGQSLWVCGADCTPVLLADPRTGRVAACHAGWRGVAARILHEAVRQLVHGGSRAEELLVALGPAISGGAYQVETAVASQVAAALGAADGVNPDCVIGVVTADPWTQLEQLRQAGALLADPEPGRVRLDIRQAARRQLLDLGIPPGQISVCPLCTHSEPELFHSWRRDRVKAVQWSGIVSQG
jgi:YfiH family protein